jgi:hypothetical protein
MLVVEKRIPEKTEGIPIMPAAVRRTWCLVICLFEFRILHFQQGKLKTGKGREGSRVGTPVRIPDSLHCSRTPDNEQCGERFMRFFSPLFSVIIF